MRIQFVGLVSALAAAALVLTVVPTSRIETRLSAQGAGLPRSADGKPDFSGRWQVMTTAEWNIQGHGAEKGVPAGLGIVEGNTLPYLPAALVKKQENYENRARLDPNLKCYLPGVPRIMYMPFPFQIFETPTTIVELFEYVHATRNVFMDTPHPPGHIDWWMGDSRGKWEGDTLVVDLIDFNDQTWFDQAGNFHSDQLHEVERYSFMDPDHINYEVAIDDPKVFTAPWKMSLIFYRHKETNLRLLEYECFAFDRPFHAPVPPK